MTRPEKIVAHMLEEDFFSRWLGLEVLEVQPGFCKLKMKVTGEMLNAHGIGHGGISYALADSAFAFASNSHGQKAVSIETSINHLLPVYAGDELIAATTEESTSAKLGHYLVRVFKNNELAALFKGVAYKKSEVWNVQ